MIWHSCTEHNDHYRYWFPCSVKWRSNLVCIKCKWEFQCSVAKYRVICYFSVHHYRNLHYLYWTGLVNVWSQSLTKVLLSCTEIMLYIVLYRELPLFVLVWHFVTNPVYDVRCGHFTSVVWGCYSYYYQILT